MKWGHKILFMIGLAAGTGALVARAQAAPGMITTVAGNGLSGYSGDGGPAVDASFVDIFGVSVDGMGNIFIADFYGDRIRRVDRITGIITTVAGNGTMGYSGDGGPATDANLYGPCGVFVDGEGNIYFADAYNYRIRRVDHATGIITSVAGNGVSAASADGGLATDTSLALPTDVFVDGAGNLILADPGEFYSFTGVTSDRIRRVDHITGIITTVAGNGTRGFSGDGGPATDASLYDPESIYGDKDGNIIIADTRNQRIRRVDHATGFITTIGGNGSDLDSGDGGPAVSAGVAFPLGVSVDKQGNIIFADDGNSTTLMSGAVRRIDAITGVVSVIAGSAKPTLGDGGPATDARLNSPNGVFVDGDGNIYVSDKNNYRIRKITFTPPPGGLTVAPNSGPTAGGTTLTISGSDFNLGASLTIGGTAATSVVVANSFQMTAVTPAGTPGAKDVVVTNPDGQSATLVGGYTYLPPQLGGFTVSPNSGPPAGGTFVVINGTNFSPGVSIKIGGVEAGSLVFLNSTQLTAVTPPGTPGVKDVVATNPDLQSMTLINGFSYIAPPGNLTVSPPSGPASGGSLLTITGSDFLSGATVKVGGVNASGVVFVNGAKLTAVTPPGTAGAQDVVVTNPDGQSSTLTGGFTYLAPPGAFSLSPTSGPVAGGTQMTITGANFAPGAAVKIDGVAAASVGYLSETQLTAVTPRGTIGVKDVVVTNPDGQSATLAGGFTYIPSPGSFTISPVSGPTSGGTSVQITGSNFMSGATVKIGAVSAVFVVFVNSTRIIAVTPPQPAGFKNIFITNPDGQSVSTIGIGYTYIDPPGSFSVSPNSGPASGGTNITITGSNFVSGATVKIDGTNAASVAFINDTQLTAVTPAGTPGAKDVVVTNPDGQTAKVAGGFTYVPPPGGFTINPDIGPTSGGTVITIAGSNFISGATVKIGGTSATSVVFVNSTQLTAVTPPGTAGLKIVVVSNPDRQSTGTFGRGFTYLDPPGSFTISPNSGPAAGGTSITITGSKFVSGATVKIDGINAASVAFIDDTQLMAVTPAGTPGAKDVVVTNPDGQIATLSGGFIFRPAPGSFTLLPNSGPASGGTDVVITGSGFFPGATVNIGGTSAVSVAFVDDTRLTAVTPAGSPGPSDVTVTNPDGQDTILRGGFTYLDVAEQTKIQTGINIFDPNQGGRGEISYILDKTDRVLILIYDRFGNEIVTLVDETRSPGSYVDKWDGRNGSGAIVASGYYNVILKTGQQKRKLKLVVMK